MRKRMARVVDQLRIPAGRFGAANDFGSIAAMFCSEFRELCDWAEPGR